MGCLALLALAYLAYWVYFRPQQLMLHYAKEFAGRGYQVYLFPFRLTGSGLVETLMSDVSRHHNANYSLTHALINYNIAISNILWQPYLILLRPDMAMALNHPQQIDALPKARFLFSILFAQHPDNLVALEGSAWRNRRKLLSHVFQFDGLKERAPQIAQICHQEMDRLE